MTVKETTPAGQSDRLRFELELRHPPAKVWRALSEPELVSQWLLPSVGLSLEPGARFELLAPPQPGWDGKVACTTLEVEAERRLSYRWVVGELDTVVCFTIRPTPEGTHLVVEQSGFAREQKRNFGGARYGWRMMTERLETLLENA